MVTIALSMAASDNNRDAIKICIENVAMWRGPHPDNCECLTNYLF